MCILCILIKVTNHIFRQRAVDRDQKKQSRENSRKRKRVISKAFVDSSDDNPSDEDEKNATRQKVEDKGYEDKGESDNEPPLVTTTEGSSSDR